MRKLKKGSRKYKGKLPFKCFNYGKVGHFTSKCPYSKNEDNNSERESKYVKKGYQSKKKTFKKSGKSLYSKDHNSSTEDSDEDFFDEEILFMVEEENMPEIEDEDIEDEQYDEEGEVDLEAKLVSALSQIKKL